MSISIASPRVAVRLISKSPLGSTRVTMSGPSACRWSSTRPCASDRRSCAVAPALRLTVPVQVLRLREGPVVELPPAGAVGSYDADATADDVLILGDECDEAVVG